MARRGLLDLFATSMVVYAMVVATPVGNLFVNAGHGHLGWTMSCGAGRVVASIVAGKQPEIDLSGLPTVPEVH